MKFILLLSALVPVFVGANLADIHHPKITVAHPTLLPSGAGVFPSGAYLAFAWSVRASDGFLDHNHAVWAAAKTTHFESGADGKVPYLFAPIESYLKFAIRLQNKIPDRHSLGNDECPAQFYLESRSLLRFQFTFPPAKVSMENFLAQTAFTPATPVNWHGITLLRGETNVPPGSADFNGALWALNTVFGRDEFRLEKIEWLEKIPADWAGKKVIVVSREDFITSGESVNQRPLLTSVVFGNWHICELYPLRGGETVRLQAVVPETVFIGVSAFPEWMSLQKL